MICPIKLWNPIEYIRRCVRMYAIHDNQYIHTMSLIYQVLQLIRCPTPWTRSEEARDMIPERCIVRVLLYRHQLYAVVPAVSYPRQHIIREFHICWYLAILRALLDMILERLLKILPYQRVLHRFSMNQLAWVSLTWTRVAFQGSRIQPRIINCVGFTKRVWPTLELDQLFLHFILSHNTWNDPDVWLGKIHLDLLERW